MRTVFVLAAVLAVGLLAAPAAAGTAPGIEWDHLFGGVPDDGADSVQQTNDGGYVVAGDTWSDGGEGTVVGTNHGAADLWVVKTNADGIVQAQRLLGGTGTERGGSVDQTTDGGFIVLGTSSSPEISDGGVTRVNHAADGSSDLWVVKLGPAGGTQTHLLLGGTGNEYAGSVQQTLDGGYILAGSSDSSDAGGFFAANHGGRDILVAKLNASGAVDWADLLGGSGLEEASCIQQTSDGGYLLAGSTWSSHDGDVAGWNHGGSDAWVVKLDGAGTVVGKRLLGGNGDDVARSVRETLDGGSVVLGSSSSSEYGDVTEENHGLNDYWVVKLDAAGVIEWQHLLGGSGNDEGQCVRQTRDGGYVLFGTSLPVDGNATGTFHGGSDWWLVKLDGSGAVLWDRPLGGTGYDRGSSVEQTGDGGYILAGASMSNQNGDVSDINNGGGAPTSDIWLVKLSPDAPAVLAVPPSFSLPTDTNGDGLYDDVNGNGRKDFADVVLYFNSMAWIAANEPVALFDCNGNGRIDFADVVWLFNRL